MVPITTTHGLVHMALGICSTKAIHNHRVRILCIGRVSGTVDQIGPATTVCMSSEAVTNRILFIVVLIAAESKNMADRCSATVLDSHFGHGFLSLPDVRGTLLIENSTFRGQARFGANHHCGVGVTGML